MAENKFGFDEVIDTLSDLTKAASESGIRKAFEEGSFNLMVFLFKAAELYPTIKEAVDDFGTFWQEIKDLTPQESLSVIAGIKANIPNPDPAQAKVISVLQNLALTHKYVQSDVYEGAKALVGEWQKV